MGAEQMATVAECLEVRPAESRRADGQTVEEAHRADGRTMEEAHTEQEAAVQVLEEAMEATVAPRCPSRQGSRATAP